MIETPDEVRRQMDMVKKILKRWHADKPAEQPAPAKVVRFDPFSPHWPDGLKPSTIYEFQCDDKGRNGTCWLRVIVAEDGDAHVSMMEWEDPLEKESNPNPFPSVRCRTGTGGGRHRRTRQALLWLAQAIRLDNEELSQQSALAACREK